ncbi:hypothetical protein ACFP1Z_26380 [Streptomyces gamaensis]|uniref:Gliding motility protein n=1 Tax=Streptomyces gamaensis TaxID=1763542 RepID=A0ABW0Z4G4_9ACTN
MTTTLTVEPDAAAETTEPAAAEPEESGEATAEGAGVEIPQQKSAEGAADSSEAGESARK